MNWSLWASMILLLCRWAISSYPDQLVQSMDQLKNDTEWCIVIDKNNQFTLHNQDCKQPRGIKTYLKLCWIIKINIFLAEIRDDKLHICKICHFVSLMLHIFYSYAYVDVPLIPCNVVTGLRINILAFQVLKHLCSLLSHFFCDVYSKCLSIIITNKQPPICIYLQNVLLNMTNDLHSLRW